MPTWVWLLIAAWVLAALIGGVVLGRALSNAEVQDEARRLVEDERIYPEDNVPIANEPPRDITAHGGGPPSLSRRHVRRRSRARSEK